MINKKVCMLGSFAVGKTALVQRFVNSIFSDKYLSSVGVRISKKSLTVSSQEVDLLLWDMEGQDDYGSIQLSYLRGAMGLFFVADGLRGETLSMALTLRNQAFEFLGGLVPSCLLLNKADISEKWEISEKVIASLSQSGLRVLCTSAKTGQGVEEAFSGLAREMLAAR